MKNKEFMELERKLSIGYNKIDNDMSDKEKLETFIKINISDMMYDIEEEMDNAYSIIDGVFKTPLVNLRIVDKYKLNEIFDYLDFENSIKTSEEFDLLIKYYESLGFKTRLIYSKYDELLFVVYLNDEVLDIWEECY